MSERRRWRPGGLRARVVWSTAVVTAVAMATMVGVVALIIANLTLSRVDDELRARVHAAAGSLSLDHDGRLHLAPRQADDVDDSVWVFDTIGNLVAGPPSGPGAREQVKSLSRVRSEKLVQRGERRYLARPVHLGDASAISGVVVASESLRPYESTRNVALLALLGFGVVVVAGTASLTAWTVGRTLRPVHRMTAQASEWSDRDLETRFDLGEVVDEFTELGNTLDALLDRVATALRDEQRLTSELAHELRTPLTAIRGEAELGQMNSPGNIRFPRIIDRVDRLSTTINTLLAVARDQARGRRRCDLHSAVVEVVAALPPTTVEVCVDIPPGRFVATVPAEVVERVVAPVLDNAVRYARTTVRIHARQTGSEVCLLIEDDGAGIDAFSPESVFEAGCRDQASDGAGLGLALARRVATSAGGDVVVVSPRDPTLFEVRLPRR